MKSDTKAGHQGFGDLPLAVLIFLLKIGGRYESLWQFHNL